MAARSLAPRLTDIIEAIERIHGVLENITLEAFESDWQRQWLVERGIEIISEASRHLTDEMKARHPEIPWQKVAGIGNVLRHKYENIAAPSYGSWHTLISRHYRKPAAMSSTRKRDRRVPKKTRSGICISGQPVDAAARDLRICFRWVEKDAEDVEIVDYH